MPRYQQPNHVRARLAADSEYDRTDVAWLMLLQDVPLLRRREEIQQSSHESDFRDPVLVAPDGEPCTTWTPLLIRICPPAGCSRVGQ